MEVKKIIYSSDIDLSLPNGPGVNEREFVESIDRIFQENFIVIVPHFQKSTPDLLLKLNKPNRDIIFLYKRSINPFLFFIKQVKIFFILRSLYKQEENTNQTLFVFRAILFPLAYILFVKIYKPKYALRICGDGTFPFLNRNIFFKTLKPINKYIMGYLYKNAIGCDAVTNTHVKSLSERYIGNFFKVDNGVNTVRFKPMSKSNNILNDFGFSADDFIIGYTGNFPHIRGGDEIVEAFNFLKKKDKLKFKAIIAGDDGGVDILSNKISKYGLKNDIKLIGKIDFVKISLIVSQLDLGVSFLDKQYRGASEQKVRQYLACGTPAIVSPGGSEFVEKHEIGSVVEHLDGINNVANEFIRYYELDPKLKELTKQRARKYAEDHISVDIQNFFRLKKWEKRIIEHK